MTDSNLMSFFENEKERKIKNEVKKQYEPYTTYEPGETYGSRDLVYSTEQYNINENKNKFKNDVYDNDRNKSDKLINMLKKHNITKKVELEYVSYFYNNLRLLYHNNKDIGKIYDLSICDAKINIILLNNPENILGLCYFIKQLFIIIIGKNYSRKDEIKMIQSVFKNTNNPNDKYSKLVNVVLNSVFKNKDSEKNNFKRVFVPILRDYVNNLLQNEKMKNIKNMSQLYSYVCKNFPKYICEKYASLVLSKPYNTSDSHNLMYTRKYKEPTSLSKSQSREAHRRIYGQ